MFSLLNTRRFLRLWISFVSDISNFRTLKIKTKNFIATRIRDGRGRFVETESYSPDLKLFLKLIDHDGSIDQQNSKQNYNISSVYCYWSVTFICNGGFDTLARYLDCVCMPVDQTQ